MAGLPASSASTDAHARQSIYLGRGCGLRFAARPLAIFALDPLGCRPHMTRSSVRVARIGLPWLTSAAKAATAAQRRQRNAT